MANASTSITIQYSETQSAAGSVSVELDTVSNNDKTSFPSAEPAHFVVFTDPVAEVEIITSMGLVLKNDDKTVPVIENIVFELSNTATLRHIPSGGVNWHWIGQNNGTPVFVGATITLPDSAVGVLYCSYTSVVQSYTLSDVLIPADMSILPVVVAVSGNGAVASLTINYSETEIQINPQSGESIYAELDTVANNGISTFSSDQDAFFVVAVNPLAPVDVLSSTGSIIQNNDKPVTTTEYVTFSFSASATLRHLPSEDVDWYWVGKNNGTPVFNGTTVTLPNPAVGVLFCGYKSIMHSYILTNVILPSGVNNMPVVIGVSSDKSVTSLTINYSSTAPVSGQPRDITLKIKDYCTDALLPGATVQITGPHGYSFSGEASETGQILLQQLEPGTYMVKTTHQGYLDSDIDAIANDSFTL